ncbi:alpha-ketoglutarate-dependent dioxygenase AlkB [Pyxidicoccus xibeiensis]|uniref:alpha-ketoglutarate-dependent dioxygenase AlkB n=1 Tax=Pyxidicoccus xibeiensis TaxID=2906759 RepID=UPI0020A6DEB2|nr:alpha-ketoglutarate-dependent dioxygenase AlkB [Pyxidicoccus xibeiensis]MCP3138612.1 alpha-ketoglutarate-dependent dioxygenase AlkB [Pyxidicoccus xibeiensis]
MPSSPIEGVELIEGFTPEPSRSLEHFQGGIPWDTRMRARLTASFGAPYDYSGITYPPVPMPPDIHAMARAVEEVVRHRITNCLINFYPEGTSSMGFHSDSYEHLEPGTTVSIISLGGPRTLRFRKKDQKAHLVDVRLDSGSLLVMQQHIQDTWLHALPPEPNAPPRMSLTFRCII